ncbi:MAG: FliO/MopB family protein [Acidobacteriota bacterium]
MLVLMGWQVTTEPLPPTGGGFFWALLQTLLALGIVCSVAYVVLRVLLPKLGGLGLRRTAGLMHIVEVLPLEPRRTLYIIEVNGKYLLVGVSDAGLQIMETLDAAAVEKQLAERELPQSPPLLAQTVGRWLTRK